MRDDSLDAFEHQDVPFEKLVERLDVRRDPSRSPIFQVMMALQNAPMGRHELPGVAFEPVPLDGETAKFDLTLVFVERPDGGLGGSLEYNRDLFDPSTAQRMIGRLRTLLGGALEDPEAAIGRLPLLAAAERHQVLREWNDTLDSGPGTRDGGGERRGRQMGAGPPARRPPGRRGAGRGGGDRRRPAWSRPERSPVAPAGWPHGCGSGGCGRGRSSRSASSARRSW